MSTSSKPKSRAPAHQNAYTFRHNKNSKLTRRIAQVGTDGLCKRCADKVEWRKKYRKYKPLTVPKKCNVCGGKKVKAAYRTICADCAAEVRCEGCGGDVSSGVGRDEREGEQGKGEEGEGEDC